jgi:hypothetical protein
MEMALKITLLLASYLLLFTSTAFAVTGLEGNALTFNSHLTQTLICIIELDLLAFNLVLHCSVMVLVHTSLSILLEVFFTHICALSLCLSNPIWLSYGVYGILICSTKLSFHVMPCTLFWSGFRICSGIRSSHCALSLSVTHTHTHTHTVTPRFVERFCLLLSLSLTHTLVLVCY